MLWSDAIFTPPLGFKTATKQLDCRWQLTVAAIKELFHLIEGANGYFSDPLSRDIAIFAKKHDFLKFFFTKEEINVSFAVNHGFIVSCNSHICHCVIKASIIIAWRDRRVDPYVHHSVVSFEQTFIVNSVMVLSYLSFLQPAPTRGSLVFFVLEYLNRGHLHRMLRRNKGSFCKARTR